VGGADPQDPTPDPRALTQSTLVYDPFFVDVPKFLGMESVNDLYKIKDGEAWLAFERGECTEEELLRDFFLDRREWDGKGMVEMLNEEYRWLPGMEAMVKDLAEQGYEQHILSNYPVWWVNIEEKLRLSRYVKVGTALPRPPSALPTRWHLPTRFRAILCHNAPHARCAAPAPASRGRCGTPGQRLCAGGH